MIIFKNKRFQRFVAGFLMASFFLLFPSVLNKVTASYRESFYRNAPPSEIFTDVVVFADDICEGDYEQLWQGTRVVKVSGGIEADLTRELYRRIKTSDGAIVDAKISEETRHIFIDPVNQSSRLQSYPEPLDSGVYFWQLKFTLYLPEGVVRRDFPIVRTNNFEVYNCEDDRI